MWNFITKLDKDLKGMPDTTLTYLLIGVAVVAVVIAIYGSPLLKAAAAAWLIAP